MPETSASERVPFSLQLGWSIGALGVATLFNAVTFLQFYFLTTQLGIAAAVAGALIFGAKIYDMVFDPLIGSASDRTESRWGRRRPYLLAGAVLASLACAALFFGPSLPSRGWNIAWAGAALVLFATGYATFNIPFLAMPAEMADDPHQRTVLMSWRTTFVLLGTWIGGLAQQLVEIAGGGLTGFRITGFVLALFVFLCCFASFLGTARARSTRRETSRPGLAEQLRLGLRNRPFLILMGVKFLQISALASGTATSLFFLRSLLGYSAGAVTLYLTATIVVSLLSIPVWSSLSRRFGKRNAYIAATLLHTVVTTTWFWAGPGESEWALYARAAALGLGSSGILLLGISLLPDTIEYDYRRSGLRREGVFSGLYATVEKLATALGPALVGFYLEDAGFIATRAGEVVQQPQSALNAVYVTIAIIPLAAKLLSVVLLFAYDLTPEKLKATTPA